MKRVCLLLVLTFSLALNVSGQDKTKSKLGFEYGLEKISYGEDNNKDAACFYVKNFSSHRATVLFKQQVCKGIYIEPQISFYHMDYEREWDYMYRPIPGVFTFNRLEIYKLNENGLGASLHLGYNYAIGNKISFDIFLAPDYRYALNSKGGWAEEVDLLSEYDFEYEGLKFPIYKKDYLILKGGIGVNYGALSLNFSYGKYVTNRFNVTDNVRLPSVYTVALGFKFGL